jgi:hypothetical protein
VPAQSGLNNQIIMNYKKKLLNKIKNSKKILILVFAKYVSNSLLTVFAINAHFVLNQDLNVDA